METFGSGAALLPFDKVRFLHFDGPVSPCVIFEDEHLLVVNKPAGLNTHAPSLYAGEGLYDWLRNQEPRWAMLAIIHRLDKETSGVMVFAKSTLANRSLTEQFTRRTVRKKYLLVTDHVVLHKEITVRSCLVRAGEKYVSRPLHAGGDVAETWFKRQHPTFKLQRSSKHQSSSAAFAAGTGQDLDIGSPQEPRARSSDPGDCTLLTAEPRTGRTHQIRVHAAESGFPVLGDVLYGGTAAARIYLHAAELTLRHPATGDELTFRAPPEFEADVRLALREALIVPELTDCFRLVHGASDRWPGWYVERLGDYLLSQSERPLHAEQVQELARLLEHFSARGAYHKALTRHARPSSPVEAAPRLVLGAAAPERFTVRENGCQFELSFNEGYSVGLFLDQRNNRCRLLTCHVAAGFTLPRGGSPPPAMLNTFAYTCGFSVCAAKAGWRTASIDLSKKYLDWGKRNFTLNQLKSAEHEFIYGDVFDWLGRLARKQRRFDAILLDPPTFSHSKISGVFRAEKDYGKLARLALPILKPSGVLFASTNAAGWRPEQFLACLEKPLANSGRKILQRHYATQPPDFPVSRSEPAYLKTVWLRIS